MFFVTDPDLYELRPQSKELRQCLAMPAIAWADHLAQTSIPKQQSCATNRDAITDKVWIILTAYACEPLSGISGTVTGHIPHKTRGIVSVITAKNGRVLLGCECIYDKRQSYNFTT
jgi:hypothetical protein